MTTKRAQLLVHQLDITWALFEYHLKDLDDDLTLWQPAEHTWTVRPVNGTWVADWADAEPDPVPAMSIGWLTWHIGFWWTTTLRHCFGGGAPAREEIGWPGGIEAAGAWLRQLKDEWRAELLALTDEELDSTARTAGLPWGEGQTLGEVAGWLNVELTKNVAEIGLVHILRAQN